MDNILAALQASWLGGRSQRRAAHIEQLVAAVENAFEGTTSSDFAVAALREVSRRLAEARQELETLGGPASDAHADLLSRVQEIYGEKAALLEEIEGAIAQRDGVTALDACERLRAATSELYDANDALTALEQLMGQEMVVLPFAFADVYHACGQVVHGQIPLEAWLECVSALEQSLGADLQALAPYQETAQASEESAALFDEVHGHLEQALEGLARIRLYAADREVSHLDDGWTMLAAAAVAMRDVLAHAAKTRPASDGPILDWGQA